MKWKEKVKLALWVAGHLALIVVGMFIIFYVTNLISPLS